MTGLGERKSDERLESWKEIATFFGRDEKTVRRWEKDLGLPVHRLPGVSKGRVYAFAGELSDWSQRPRGSEVRQIEAPADTVSQPSRPQLVLVQPTGPASEIPISANFPSIKKEHRLPGWQRLKIALVALAVMIALGTAFALHSRKLAAGSGDAARVGHKTNPEAERLYLEGRYYWNQRTAAGLTRAIDDFAQSIVLDPQDARPYAGLADSYNLIEEYTAMPADEAFPRAETAARKAIELDPNLAEAHRALAFPSFWYRFDVPTARSEFERAIALNPNDGTAHLWYANMLTVVGDYPKSLAEVDRAQQLDPSSSAVRADKGIILYEAGKKDEAIALLRQMKRNEPDFVSPHRYLAEIYFDEANYPDYLVEAAETARLAARPDDTAQVEAEKKGYERAGARGLFEGKLAVQQKLYAQGKVSAYSLAQAYALLGNNAEALRYLQISRGAHESVIVALDRDVVLRGLHQDPEYKKLVAEVGIR